MSTAGDRLINDLFRDIAQNDRSGLLRLTSGRVIKAIFFESGVPVFAISNQANEQLDYALLEKGWVTQSQIDQAKQAAGQPQKLGPTLMSSGILEKAALETAVSDLAKQVILSVFVWVRAESAFDERVRTVHDVKVQWSAAECILEGVRSAASQTRVAEALAPADAIVTRAPNSGKLGASGKLTPAEMYVLSRVESEMQVGELGALTGLGEEEAQRAVCALLAVGLLKVPGEEPEPELAGKDPVIIEVEDDIARKTHFFLNADHYEVLGVGMRATPAEIKTAYYKLAKKYHPDRYRQPEHYEIRLKLDSLFSRISRAYETLGDATQRMLYDDQLRKSGGGTAKPATVAPPPPPPPPAPPRQDKPKGATTPLSANEDKQKAGTATLPPRQDKARNSGPLPSKQEKPKPATGALPPKVAKPQTTSQSASHEEKPKTGPSPLPQDRPHAHASAPAAESRATSSSSSSAKQPHQETTKEPGAEPIAAHVGNGAGDAKKSDPAADASSSKSDQKPALPAHPGGATTPAQTAEFYYQQARARIDQKDYYGGLQLLREACKLDPVKPHYHFHLGMNLLRNPRTRHEGEYHLTKAAQLDPFNAQIRIKIGAMYKEAGLAKKAEHFFRDAIALDPGNRVALRELQAEAVKKKGEDTSIWKSDLGTIAKRILKK